MDDLWSSVRVAGGSLVVLTVFACHVVISGAFTLPMRHNGLTMPSPALHLVPISSVRDPKKRSFLDSSVSYRTCINENGELNCDDGSKPYIISIVQEDDLPAISKLTVDAFGSDAITLSGDLSVLEKGLLQPGIGAFNAYSGAVAFTEVLSGLRQRMMNRIDDSNNLGTSDVNSSKIEILLAPPPVSNVDDKDAAVVASKSSLILALGREVTGGASGEIEAIATVELRLQPTDAKIPFSEPWFDKVERNCAKLFNMDISPKDKQLQPYLSNLCVDQSVRGRQIGKAMCRVVESIAKDAWGYEKLYLHVDLENVAALNLYKKEGFNDVGSRWNPFWAGQAAEIGYYVKHI